ncbi:MAG: hypothetical protein LIO86_00220 [Lachnospiraceae bacterium]|nr:hypothetical protein [Lachnospiraceae bacterium]
MGFIDYQGTKKDRYEEVLAFAKAQQEEEARRREGVQPEVQKTTALPEQASQSDVQESPTFLAQNARNPARPQFDREHFQALIEEKSLPAYAEAFGLLRKCPLPEEMDGLYGELSGRLLVLQEALDKFQESYQPDLFLFYEYYVPEALRLAATYIDYLDAGAGEKTLDETGAEVLDAAKRLLLAVNEKIDEIYQFAAMETKAEARALESMLSQAGYIDPEYRIKKQEDK